MNVCRIKNKKRIDEESMQNFRISLVINRIFLFWVPKKIDFAFSLLFMPCMGIENQHLKHLPSFPLKCPSSPFLPSTLQWNKTWKYKVPFCSSNTAPTRFNFQSKSTEFRPRNIKILVVSKHNWCQRRKENNKMFTKNNNYNVSQRNKSINP